MSTGESKEVLMSKVLSRFDVNNDGIITLKEFKDSLVAEGVDEVTADAIRKQVFKNWDGNEDGKLQKFEIEDLAKRWASFG